MPEYMIKNWPQQTGLETSTCTSGSLNMYNGKIRIWSDFLRKDEGNNML